jgi:hypothetical protein
MARGGYARGGYVRGGYVKNMLCIACERMASFCDADVMFEGYAISR